LKVVVLSEVDEHELNLARLGVYKANASKTGTRCSVSQEMIKMEDPLRSPTYSPTILDIWSDGS
jgi:hypothetical protein